MVVSQRPKLIHTLLSNPIAFLICAFLFDSLCRHRRCLRSLDLTNLRQRQQRERQKAIGLMSRTTTLHVHHAFLYISLQSLHNYDVK